MKQYPDDHTTTTTTTHKVPASSEKLYLHLPSEWKNKMSVYFDFYVDL